ncbi:hypothetical protein [Amycolatopsis sp. RTGN1]|uniref:hypothetical protein n=1 Tax=Amycolatopsis ponsaeliensis TaxID=2992142 RepID=UPI00254B936D|nr:hypothetical protein [Amycolatopsis sp. RTGN1]
MNDIRQMDAVAYVCRNEEHIRAGLVADGADTAALDAVLTCLRDGGDLTAALDALHATLRECGDTLGILGHRLRQVLPGVGDGPVEIVYLCPRGWCSGRRRPRPDEFPLRCAITGEGLRREKL